jgi:2-polyprenyl-3-methyl-5-hydroxy-6-metoxy-1,4-benzoquinol methylase
MKVREFDYRIRATPIKIDWEDTLSHKMRYVLVNDLIVKSDPRNLLDIGCGKGIIEYLLPENIFCLGCDIVEEAIGSARLLNQHKKNRQFLVCDVEKTLPSYEKFDVIVISEVLEHLSDDEEALRKMRNLLADEGMLIITVPNSERIVNQFASLLGQPICQEKSHLREYTVPEINALLNRCRFKTQAAIGICLQLPKEKYLPEKFRFAMSFLVDDVVAKKLPSLANSILVVAKKC